MRGKVKGHPKSDGNMGSPSRMRGKAAQALGVLGNIRITPAHAGKSIPTSILIRMRKDHPRACGEKEGTHAQIQQSVGSPSRMRGKDSIRISDLHGHRITPAHAGKSPG